MIKNIVIVISICANAVLGFMVYNEITYNRETPTSVAFEFRNAVFYENYNLAKELIAEISKENVSDETLKYINESMGSDASYDTYELIDYGGGKMVLLNITPLLEKTPNNRYEIQDVKIVPKEYQSLFIKE